MLLLLTGKVYMTVSLNCYVTLPVLYKPPSINSLLVASVSQLFPCCFLQMQSTLPPHGNTVALTPTTTLPSDQIHGRLCRLAVVIAALPAIIQYYETFDCHQDKFPEEVC